MTNTYVVTINHDYFILHSSKNKVQLTKELFHLRTLVLEKALYNFYNKSMVQYFKLYKRKYHKILHQLKQFKNLRSKYPQLNNYYYKNGSPKSFNNNSSMNIAPAIHMQYLNLLVNLTEEITKIPKIQLKKNSLAINSINTNQLMLNICNQADAAVEQLPNFKFTVFWSISQYLNKCQNTVLLTNYLEEISKIFSMPNKRHAFIQKQVQNTKKVLLSSQEQQIIKNNFSIYLVKHTNWQKISKNKLPLHYEIVLF